MIGPQDSVDGKISWRLVIDDWPLSLDSWRSKLVIDDWASTISDSTATLNWTSASRSKLALWCLIYDSHWLSELNIDDRPLVLDHLQLTCNDLIGLMRRSSKKDVKVR